MDAQVPSDVRFYGHLRKRFGKGHPFAVSSTGEAIRACCSQFPGFQAYVESHNGPGYRILVDEEPQTLDTLGNPVSGGSVIKIVPVVAGAHDFEQVLIGAAMIAFAMYNPLAWSTVAGSWGAAALGASSAMGWAMVLGGVASMLAQAPNVGQAGQNGPSDMPSYSFGSPTVTIGQGRPVPLLYGQVRVGGAVVSAGIVSEGYQHGGFGGAANSDLGTLSGDGDTIPWVAAIGPDIQTFTTAPAASSVVTAIEAKYGAGATATLVPEGTLVKSASAGHQALVSISGGQTRVSYDPPTDALETLF